MKEQDVGAVLITDNKQLVGMVTDRDIALRAAADGADWSKLTAKDVMTKNVATCQEGDSIHHAAQLMETRNIRRLPVLDHAKNVVGIVSLGDISHGAPHDVSTKLMQAVSAHHP
ncbi:MAG TPA: CBS domain-containing protein [Vitreimonas sp.]|jgi:CBS domain-containing protein|nr:CBS domain-containing protein [Vitreimonas sp.]